MSTSDTSERGLKPLICTAFVGHPCDPPAQGAVADPPTGYGGVGWSGGNFHDYDRDYCVDLVQLAAFLWATQPQAAEALALSEDGPTRRAVPAVQPGLERRRGEPAQSHGLAIDYVWREVLTQESVPTSWRTE